LQSDWTKTIGYSC